MRVLAQEEYGLRCLLRVAELTDAGPAPLSEIASAEGLSPEYAGRLLQRLRRAGFLDAARGPGGGYRLARPATGISVRSVIEVFDDPNRQIERQVLRVATRARPSPLSSASPRRR